MHHIRIMIGKKRNRNGGSTIAFGPMLKKGGGTKGVGPINGGSWTKAVTQSCVGRARMYMKGRGETRGLTKCGRQRASNHLKSALVKGGSDSLEGRPHRRNERVCAVKGRIIGPAHKETKTVRDEGLANNKSATIVERKAGGVRGEIYMGGSCGPRK